MILRGTLLSKLLFFSFFANMYLASTFIFGGPVVIPHLREYVVAESWVFPRDFLIGLAIQQSFSGPNFNFAVYLGALSAMYCGVSLCSLCDFRIWWEFSAWAFYCSYDDGNLGCVKGLDLG